MKDKTENEWRAEDDLRTLMEADKIRKDPERLKNAKAMAKKKLDAMQSVVGQGAKK